MPKVVLVNPNRMKPAVAPVGLDYLAESLAAAGHQVEVLDLCFSPDWRADVDSWFAGNTADMVGFTIRNTDDCYFASRDFFIPLYGEMVRRIRERSGAPVVLGGAGLSVTPEAVLESTGADFAIAGEGEVSFPMTASGEPPENVPGLVYRTPDGIRRNPPRWMDLSLLPIRSRRWLDNQRYFREGGQAGIETKRGCDRHCIYCADPIGKGKVCRLRPPSHILAEVRALVGQGVDCFHLCDSEFNIPLSHAEAACREIIGSDLAGRFTWYTYASPAPFTDELADLMKRAGCLGIDFGADSGDDAVLRSLGRDFTSQDVRRTAEICRRHGIIFMYDLLVGGPGETFESASRTISLMKELRPDRVGVSVGVRIYDGAPLSRAVLREGFSPSNPSLHGQIEGNESFLMPVYYISPTVGLDILDHLTEQIAGDPIFLHASREQIEANYNYNDNTILVQAIKEGHRGAYWDILRRVSGG